MSLFKGLRVPNSG